MKTHTLNSNETRAAGRVRQPRLQKVLLVCGLLAALVWLGTDVYASLTYEGYRYPLDPISGLSATDAPTKAFVVPLDYLYALLKIAFAGGVWLSAGRHRALCITAVLLLAFALTDLAAYSFPWNPAEAVGTLGNLIHGLLAGGLAVLLILLTIGFGAGADGRWFRLYSYGTLLAMILMGTLPLLGGQQTTGNRPPEWFGAAERVNGYGYMLWMTVLAFVLLRRQPGESVPER